MPISIAEIEQASKEYQDFKLAYTNAGASLSKVISTGTILFNDPNFLEIFPNTFPAFQTYLLNLQTAINNFIGALPVEPPLEG